MTEEVTMTAEERGLLSSTASMVGHSVLISNRDVPRRVRKKARALEEAYASTAGRFPSNRLVQGSVENAERSSKGENSFRTLRKEREEYLAETLEACRRVSQVLATKVSPTEGEEFKRWLLAIGEAVGESVASGEFLGIGPERYSEEEIESLQAVAGALGVSGYSAPKARTVQVGRA
jgi:hypothetical protein